jgi:hypothetical protein
MGTTRNLYREPPVLPGEEWRPVHLPAFATIYSVSNLGRVRRDTPGPGTKVGYILRNKRVRGYCQVLLRNNGQHKYAYPHHLVLHAFTGPPPGGPEMAGPLGWQANHKDGDKHNNRIDNLEWVTDRENKAHAASLGLYVSGDRSWARRFPELVRRGADAPGARLTWDQVDAIRAVLASSPPRGTQRRLALEYGVAESTICLIKTGGIYVRQPGTAPKSPAVPDDTHTREAVRSTSAA